MKNLLIIAFTTLALATSCKKDNDSTPAAMQLSGNLSGSNEVPVIATSATGSLTGTYDPTSRVLDYSVTFTGLSANATSGHFHFGDAKHTLGAVFVVFSNVPAATSGTITGTATLTQPQADSLKMGHVYVNIHSGNHKADGEIRATAVVK